MEIGNYTVEPSSIFMGRGKHPLRGRWKEGPREEDIELNLSPDAPRFFGKWKETVWEPDSMWIARWRDKISGKMKYVWLHDATPFKQEKDIEKFDKARELNNILPKVKRHITENLDHEDMIRRKTATVTFLIDHCKFRVGDEKDEDEADTIGASTLRPEHISFNGDGTITFDFLGKDSVHHNLCLEMPEQVIDNLKDFSADPTDNLFNGVNSKRVSDFLDEVMTGLSAKVFRTYYASTAVEAKLNKTKIDPKAPDYVKKHSATLANLEAAKVCNHKRTIPKSWMKSLENQKQRLKERQRRAKKNITKYRKRIQETEKRYNEQIVKYEKKLRDDINKLEKYLKEFKEREAAKKSIKGVKKRVASKKRVIKNGKARINKTIKNLQKRLATLRENMDRRRKKDKELIEKTKLQIRAKELTKDYNLNTSLKSYIDPRIYYDWGQKINYDWKNYYSKTLRKKFSWVENDIY
jgi:DNA topoisomerase-1